jgi:hypothetical protein
MGEFPTLIFAFAYFGMISFFYGRKKMKAFRTPIAPRDANK